jgi:hypothetical protein
MGRSWIEKQASTSQHTDQIANLEAPGNADHQKHTGRLVVPVSDARTRSDARRRTVSGCRAEGAGRAVIDKTA